MAGELSSYGLKVLRKGLIATDGVTFLGQVATRCMLPLAVDGSQMVMSRSMHIARDAIVSLQIRIANWSISSIHQEIGIGARASVTASVEYPAGTFRQIKFFGSATGFIPDMTTLMSDSVAVSIPRGASFWIRIFRNCAAGFVYTGLGAQHTAGGEAISYGASIADQTMGGTITSSDTQNIITPLSIVAKTAVNSVYLLGDSRMFGYSDTTYDATGDKGEVARAVGPVMPYINAGVPGDTAAQFVVSHALRMQEAQFCSRVVLQYGINDTGGLRPDAAIRADLITIRGYSPPSKPVWLTTMPPVTSGAWTAADGSDQTIPTSNTIRVPNNDWRRTVPPGFAGCFELADVVEDTRNGGKWKADGTVGKFTPDGVHETTYANLAIRDSGAINVAALAA